MLLSFGIAAFASSTVASGTCGANLTWTLDSDGVLTISGTGMMDSYCGDRCWKQYLYDIKAVKIDPGVTSVGARAFYYTGANQPLNIESVTMPDSIEIIDRDAFYDCDKLTFVEIPSGVKVLKAYSFVACTNLSTVKISSSLESIEAAAFSGCGVKEVIYDGTVEQWATLYKNSKIFWPDVTIKTSSGEASICRWCGEFHIAKNFFDKIKIFFHKVFAELFGYRYS